MNMYRQHKILMLLVTLSVYSLFGQTYSGKILDSKTNQPIAYVNIGVLLKNTGTVSDDNGNFQLLLKKDLDNDTLKISCIGYQSLTIKTSDFKQLKDKSIYLNPSSILLSDVIIKAKKYKYKTLGITTNSDNVQTSVYAAKGYECGILIKLNKPAIIQKIHLNVAQCTYDTVFYRLNIYNVERSGKYTNILERPIYIKIAKDKMKDKISINLMEYNIRVNNDFLISLEYVKDLGPGKVSFCSSLFHASYFREASQGDWLSVPLGGFSLSVDVAIEK